MSAAEKAIYYKKKKSFLAILASRIQQWRNESKVPNVGSAAVAGVSTFAMCHTNLFEQTQLKSNIKDE